jgi:hypothetical protein
VRPDLLVADSDFFCFPCARSRGIPIVSVNSSPAVISLFPGMGPPPAGMLFSYWCIEKVDLWLQRRYADMIICPVIEPVETGIVKVWQVAPIVRGQFLGKTGSLGREQFIYDVAVMLGGSGIGAAEIDMSDFTGSIVVLGDESGGRYPSTAQRVAFTAEPAAYLSRCRVVVIQGGLNSVSEAIALRKPAVIVPIPNHSEQLVNARCAQRLGIGVVARGGQTSKAARYLLNNYDHLLKTCQAIPVTCDGAMKAAHLIEGMVGG